MNRWLDEFFTILTKHLGTILTLSAWTTCLALITHTILTN